MGSDDEYKRVKNTVSGGTGHGPTDGVVRVPEKGWKALGGGAESGGDWAGSPSEEARAQVIESFLFAP